jgi:glutaminase
VPSQEIRARVDRRLEELYRRHLSLHDDEVEGYYESGVGYHRPEIPGAEQKSFSICLATTDGEVFVAGDHDLPFALQSISKSFVYGLALEACGRERVLARVGVEPSGDAFNSIVFDERHNRPFNPMVNAGALATTDLVGDGDAAEPALAHILNVLRRYPGNGDLEVDEDVFEAEMRTADRNRATAYLMRSEGMLEGDVEATLALYLRQCSVHVTCRELALMAATLANGGVNPATAERAFGSRHLRDILSVMYICGMYDFAGEWAYRVGIPAKSGVSGGVLAVVPGKLGLGVYSPGLDAYGNSVRGTAVCEEISQRLGLHVFADHREDALLGPGR